MASSVRSISRQAERPAAPGSVWGYARISDSRNGDTDSTDRQAWDIRRLHQSLGLPGAPTMLVEQGSASRHSRKSRAEFVRLTAAMAAGTVTDLLLWHTDRWLRRPTELEQLIDLVEACGTRVHAVHGGRVDLTSAEGRLSARIMTGVAAFESDHRSDRVRAASRQRAEHGGSHGGGRRPYGYDKTGMILVPAEARIVAELTTRIVSGESTRALAADLRARGVPTPTGTGQWSALGVRGIVWRARNAGLREHGGTKTRRGVLTDAAWPALVERPEWEAACGILTDPARKTSPGNNPTTLLSGIAVCEDGHRIVSGGGRRHGRRTYVCVTAGDNRGHISRVAAPVDELVVAVLCGVEGQPGLLAHHGLGIRRTGSSDPSLALLRAQADGIRGNIARLEDSFADGAMTPEGFKRNAVRLRADVAEIERQIAVYNVPDAAAGLQACTAEQFVRLPLDRQRTVVRELLTVVLHRARRAGPFFDPDTVDIRPRTAE